MHSEQILQSFGHAVESPELPRGVTGRGVLPGGTGQEECVHQRLKLETDPVDWPMCRFW